MERALDVSTPLIATRWGQSHISFVDLVGCFNVVSCERHPRVRDLGAEDSPRDDDKLLMIPNCVVLCLA